MVVVHSTDIGVLWDISTLEKNEKNMHKDVYVSVTEQDSKFQLKAECRLLDVQPNQLL